MKPYYIWGLLLLSLYSCNPCRQSAKVIARCPAAASDTTYIERIDTVVISEVSTDTSFSIDFDTVLIDTGRVHVQLIRRDSTIYVRATCKADTVTIKGKDRVITKTIAQETAWYYRWALWGFFILLVIIALANLAKKYCNLLAWD